MAGIPGLTITSQGSNPLPKSGSISFAGGTPLQISGNQIAPAPVQHSSPVVHVNVGTSQPPTSGPQPSFSAPQQPDMSAQIDSIYNPAIGALDSQIGQLQNSIVPSENSQIDTSSGQAKSNLDSQQQAYDLQNQNDQNKLGTVADNAYSQAQNQYNQLLQRNMAIYGGGSSAGGAISALLGQGYQQQSGGIWQSYQQGLSDLLTQHSQYVLWTNQQKSQIDSDVTNMKKQVQDQMQQEISAINNNKAMLEGARASAKLNVMQQAVQNQQAIDLYGVQKAIDLQAWSAQQNQSYQQQAATLAQNQAQFMSQNPFSQYANNPNQFSNPTTAQSSAPGFFGQANNQQQDQFGGLLTA